jgi:hypothetical protein
VKVGKRTAKLIREAAVMGFVHGSMWGRAFPDRHGGEQFPRDSDILARVMRGARSHRDLYPTLGRAEGVEPGEESP